MKTINDLKEMKKQSLIPFGTAYSFLITQFADYYLSKVNGIGRIRQGLQEWNEEARGDILNDVISEIAATDIAGFDPQEFLKEVQ